MAEDRTLLAFISGGSVGAGTSRLRTSLEDQFVNSALIRTRLASDQLLWLERDARNGTLRAADARVLDIHIRLVKQLDDFIAVRHRCILGFIANPPHDNQEKKRHFIANVANNSKLRLHEHATGLRRPCSNLHP
ncbi:hypothetical protein ALC57_05793 [Trachymyrmex cornetzi]|uniref:Uncharacterized protein n=1 Tax=Trachymyrmex cornetzi TaxID=471704 RepID=A0A151J9R6_9HYME|nr:hypothetical protein ALC57_05793 [Trachymyrmex cornetzi]